MQSSERELRAAEAVPLPPSESGIRARPFRENDLDTTQTPWDTVQTPLDTVQTPLDTAQTSLPPDVADAAVPDELPRLCAAAPPMAKLPPRKSAPPRAALPPRTSSWVDDDAGTEQDSPRVTPPRRSDPPAVPAGSRSSVPPRQVRRSVPPPPPPSARGNASARGSVPAVPRSSLPPLPPPPARRSPSAPPPPPPKRMAAIPRAVRALQSRVDTLVGFEIPQPRIGPPRDALTEQAPLGPSPFGTQNSEFDLSPYLRRTPLEIPRMYVGVAVALAFFFVGSMIAFAASGDGAGEPSKSDAKSGYQVAAAPPIAEPEPIEQPRLVAPEPEVSHALVRVPEAIPPELETLTAEPEAIAPEPESVTAAPEPDPRAERRIRRRARARARVRAERRSRRLARR